MERLLQNVPVTLSATFQVDGVATDPSPATATIEIVRDDGTSLVAAGTATTRTAAGVFTYALSAVQTAQLDLLTVKWTSSLGTIVTHAEVVGGFLFSIADARALPALASSTTYPTASIVAARTLAEQALEDACGVAFVPRYRKEALDGNYQDTLLLQRPRPTALRSVTINGTPLSGPDLAAVVLRPTGELYRAALWPGIALYGGSAIWGSQALPGSSGNITVAYEHGYPYPPARVSRAALLLAKRWLVDSPVDERTTQVSTEGGTISFLSAGAVGPFDLPEVVATMREYGHLQGVA